MLKTTLKITALSAVSLTLLTACGGSGGGAGVGGNGNNNSLTPPSNPTSAVADRVVSVRQVGLYNNGGTPYSNDLSLEEEERVELDNSYDIKVSETQGTFALVQSGNNLVMTVNGTAYTFTPELRDQAIPATTGNAATPAGYTWTAATGGTISSNRISLHGGADLRTVISGTHSTIQGDYVRYSTASPIAGAFNGTLDYTQGFATIGIQTPASVVASQTATATYTGRVELNLQSNFTKTAGIDNYADPLVRPYAGQFNLLGGTLTMTVDFTANTIAGEEKYDLARVENGRQVVVEGREAILTFNSAPIVGNGFAGTFTMNDDYQKYHGLTSNNPAGNHYAGNFFGPNADDIAGVLRFDGQAGVVGIGGFRADRDTQ